jgi:hypothetical protein
LFEIGFWNVEGLRRKVGNKHFLDVRCDHDIFGIAESWAGLEVFEINGFISYSKGRSRVAKLGRNPAGLVVYIRKRISERVTEISTNVEEKYGWVLGRRGTQKIQVGLCMGFVCSAPQTSRWYDPNSTRELEADKEVERPVFKYRICDSG